MSTPTVPVYVTTPDVSMAFFAPWPLDDIDSVIPLLRRWGLTDVDGTYLDVDINAVGEFIVEGRQVVFRVSVLPD